MFTRRRFLQSLGAAAALPHVGKLRAETYPFSLGVASGYPSPSSIALWTRLIGVNPLPIRVRWELAADEAFKSVVRYGEETALPEWAHSVHLEVEGLEPERWYWYRFAAGDAQSRIGRTRTAPLATALPDRLRFAFASCQHYEQGLFTAYEHMAREDLDLVLHLGDYIY